MPQSHLFSGLQVGSLRLANRIVMAPMTRLRAFGGVPTPLMANYYAQRASAGLIVTECTMVEARSSGYMNCPGIFTQQQVEGWAGVTRAVREQGGLIFLQLWHCGRVSHPSLQPEGESPVAPSAIAAAGDLHTPLGKSVLPVPRALSSEEIPGIVEHFRRAAENAKSAGFDGVELHGAFGYLIDQFLQDVSNHRSDRYGGNIENRSRFCLEVVQAVLSVWGPDRVGIKLSPASTLYGMLDSSPLDLYGYLLTELSRLPLAYVHLMEPGEKDRGKPGVLSDVLKSFRLFYQGRIISNGGHTKESADQAVSRGDAELVSFGRPFLANPDLVARFRADAPLQIADFSALYGRAPEGAERGYTDYPTLAGLGNNSK